MPASTALASSKRSLLSSSLQDSSAGLKSHADSTTTTTTTTTTTNNNNNKIKKKKKQRQQKRQHHKLNYRSLDCAVGEQLEESSSSALQHLPAKPSRASCCPGGRQLGHFRIAMVLFLESETLQLLELYAELRAEPQNVTSNGVLLKQQAREQLTTALNASFPRKQPWSEGQVSVKFKNLRAEYAELRWLSAQPGFRADGAGLPDAWWAGIKARRPKAHAFKDKLPWVYEAHMRAIVGDGVADQSRRAKQAPQQEQTSLSTPQREQSLVGEQVVTAMRTVHVEAQPRDALAAPPPAPTVVHVASESRVIMPATLTPTTVQDAAQLPQLKRKRSDESDTRREEENEEDDADRGSCYGSETRGAYSCSLARSVEQSAVAAAGMARGFQDLIAMFQEQTATCRALEQRTTEAQPIAEQRGVLLAVARSLEQSTRATADMAKGYRELVSAFVREADRQREC
ncbi:unnamed protein product [Phytophthora lilii]|uniref:Unnamed protein product n=1 Tax=Phytophthora lilii TaxID=2077276 RepID=A0A9W6TK33_9STRA|nr:unnamed protein product [Phytophthora lilii]